MVDRYRIGSRAHLIYRIVIFYVCGSNQHETEITEITSTNSRKTPFGEDCRAIKVTLLRIRLRNEAATTDKAARDRATREVATRRTESRGRRVDARESREARRAQDVRAPRNRGEAQENAVEDQDHQHVVVVGRSLDRLVEGQGRKNLDGDNECPRDSDRPPRKAIVHLNFCL